PANGRLVLYGGDFADSGPWESRDGATWTELATAGPAPTPRDETQMVFDPTRNALWLLGGYYNGSPVSDVQLLTGNTWSLGPAHDDTFVTDAPGQPSIYDPQRERVIVLEDGNGTYDRALQYDATDGWRPLCDPCSGSERKSTSMVHVPEYDQTFLI